MPSSSGSSNSSALWQDSPVEWMHLAGLSPYKDTHARMQARALDIAKGHAREAIWLLEHPPLYTAGTSAKPDDLIAPDKFEIHAIGRGGKYTYHGPGQRVAYVMLNLAARGRDISAFIHGLEQWIINSLQDLGLKAERREGRIGVWVVHGDGREDKIAAIGVRLKKWVSYHGISLNVNPDMSHFSGIIPCGLQDYGVTSLAALGLTTTMEKLDQALLTNFETLFSPIQKVEPQKTELGLESQPILTP